MMGTDWKRFTVPLLAAIIGIALFVFPTLGFVAALLAIVFLAAVYSRKI